MNVGRERLVLSIGETTNLSVSYLVFHLPRLLRRSAEEEDTAGQSVEPVYRPQVLQVVLLGEDEDDRVVPVSAARVHLQYPKRSRDLFAEKTEEREKERDD